MLPIDLLIWDLDGTLLDSKQAIINSINFMLRQVGRREKSANAICSYVGRGVRYLVEQAIDGDQLLLDRALIIFQGDYRQRIAREGKIFDGAREVLAHFGDKKKAVVSNGDREMIEFNLRRQGIIACFDMLVGGDEGNCVKPAACQLEWVLKKMEVQPEKALMIGDMAIDVLAGKNAGTKTCGATYGIGSKSELISAAPDFLIDDIRELMNLIC